MHIPARILRNDAARADRNPPTPTTRDLATRDRIVDLGQVLMARHGRHAISMTAFALALGHCTATIRRHFADLDALLGSILQRHLQRLSEALSEVPWDAPDRQAALRAAYLGATRATLGGLTEGHLLLVRDRHLLPEDELTPVEDTLYGIGCILAGDHGAAALALLDTPALSAPQIECMMEGLRLSLEQPKYEAEPTRLDATSPVAVRTGLVNPAPIGPQLPRTEAASPDAGQTAPKPFRIPEAADRNSSPASPQPPPTPRQTSPFASASRPSRRAAGSAKPGRSSAPARRCSAPPG